MSKQRIIKDEIWDDEWFYDLDPSEKLVWLFLLTNPRNNIAGVYQINNRWIANLTGFDKDVIATTLGRFQRAKKIALSDSWIVILNFHKHQSSNPKVESGVIRIIEELPLEIRRLLPMDSLCIAYPTLLNSTLLNSTLPNGKKESEPKIPKEEVKEEVKEEMKVDKESYGDFQKVKLTTDEYNNLVETLTEPIAQTLIVELDEYIASKGVKYKSHYATIRAWARKRMQDHATRMMSTKPKSI